MSGIDGAPKKDRSDQVFLGLLIPIGIIALVVAVVAANATSTPLHGCSFS